MVEDMAGSSSHPGKDLFGFLETEHDMTSTTAVKQTAKRWPLILYFLIIFLRCGVDYKYSLKERINILSRIKSSGIFGIRFAGRIVNNTTSYEKDQQNDNSSVP